MLDHYLTFPLACEKLMQGQRQQRSDLSGSIRQHIHLILRTHYHEYRFDSAYGCLVWEKDFETIRSIYKWKEELQEAFLQALTGYEKRLTQVQVSVDLDEQKIVDTHTQQVSHVRKRIIIQVRGITRQTNETFTHTEYIFFSPLSLI